ncbi:hypothetical protein GS462_26540 [Rhodococcus hoagii]|nr:hypothetical protein [Prescottella equi]
MSPLCVDRTRAESDLDWWREKAQERRRYYRDIEFIIAEVRGTHDRDPPPPTERHMTVLSIIAPLALLVIVLITTATLRKVADLEQTPPRKVRRPDSSVASTTNTHLATDQFEALTHCPGCGTYGPHLMREPRCVDAADIEAWERRRREFLDQKRGRIEVEAQTIGMWGGGSLRTITNLPVFKEPRPLDETEYATIRICECGKEWGQK